MRILFLFIAIFSIIVMKAQTVKTFSGKTISGGTITYTYYFDEDGNKIMHGSFKTVEKEKFYDPLKNGPNEIGNITTTVTGTTKHGKRDGLWTCTIIETNVPINYTMFRNSTKTYKISFKDCIASGTWDYSKTGKTRTRDLILGRGYVYSGWTPIKSEYTQMPLVNGKLHGFVKDKDASIGTTSGQFSNGFLVGKWKDDTYTQDGILKETIVNNKQYKYDKSIELYKRYIELSDDSIKKELLYDNRLKIDTVSFYPNFTKTFDIKEFRLDYGYTYNEPPVTSGIIAKYIKVSFIEQITLDQFIKKYNIQFEYSRLEDKIDIINEHLIELSDEDIKILVQKIEEVDAKEQERLEDIKLMEERREKLKEEGKLVQIKQNNFNKMRIDIQEQFIKKLNPLSYDKRLKEYSNIPQYLEEYLDKFEKNELKMVALDLRSIIVYEIFRKRNVFAYHPISTLRNSYGTFYKEYKLQQKKFHSNERKIIENAAIEFGISL